MDNQHLNHSNQSGLAAFKASLFFKIIDWCLINTMLFLCITVDTLAYSHSVRAAELPANIELTQLIQIGNSTQTGVKRITRNDFDFTYTLNISYIGDTPIQQVKGHLICLSPSTQIIDADIDFGNLTPGQTLTGKDTYTIRQDRSKPFNPSDLKWSFTYNHPPIAEAGSDQSVPVGAEVILDGVGQFDAVVPIAAKSMQELAEWLERQRANATDDFALGAARFQEMLKATEGVNLPLDALEKAGRDDLQRNLAALKEECKHYAPDASVQSCVEKVEAQKPPEGAVAEARRQLTTLRSFVAGKGFVSIPSQEEATVAESPPFNRWNLAYIDIPGPFEHGLPSIYYVAPPDPAWTPKEQAAYVPGKTNLLFISAHEVWPGHFLQHLHAHQAGSKFGQLFSSYAFSEGWAHYSEELMWESGLNAGDAETHIGQILNALIRNVRFLSSIGLHTQGMTVETSEKMFRELAFRDEGNARQQAARGTFDPAYLNYTLGKLMIRKLRVEWTATRGGRAAWKSFHDTFLSYGAPPIPLVRKAMLVGDSGAVL